MSFLSGLKSIAKGAVGWISGNSFAANLAKTAILGYAVNKMAANTNKSNAARNENIDNGIRLQIPPASDNKVPVVYGTAFLGGVITDAEMTADNKTMYYVLTISEKTSASSHIFKDIYWNDQRCVFRSDGITVDYTVDRSGTIDRSTSGLVRVYCYAGSSTQGQVPQNYTGTVPAATSVVPSWSAGSQTMSDLVFAVVRVDYNRDKNVKGIGQMKFELESSLNQPGSVLLDYMTNEVYGAGIPVSDIDTQSLTDLNTYSNTSVNYTDETLGVNQVLAARYRINGVVDTSRGVTDNIETLASGAGSWMSYDVHEGRWSVIVNKPDTSVASFSDSNILGTINISGTGLQELYNRVKVEFPNRDIRDRADFQSVAIPPADRNPNEYDNTLNIAYDILNEPVQAELLGFIELKQSRVDLLVRFETDFSYINLKAGDVVDVSNTRYGWSNKLFRIVSISEIQNDEGALSLDITALEYDATVYSTADLYRYARSNQNGIITIGSIGVPAIPQITKIEKDSRPRLLMESISPTGIVEGIEYWLTTDVTLDEENRSYSLVGVKRPVNGNTFPSGSTVVLDYTQSVASNFLVKVRGFNTTTTGPFSDPSGLVEFVPVQVTEAIDPDTGVLDGTGGLLAAVALFELINLLSGLWSGTNGAGTLFDKIFEIFQDVTGTDLVGTFSGTSAYALSANPNPVLPGEPVIVKLTASGVANGTTVPYTITGATSADLGGASLTGSFTVQNSAASLTLNIASDATPGTFTLTLDGQAVDVTVQIQDPSTVPTYSLSADPASVDEGEAFNVTLLTTNVADGTTIGYTISGTSPGVLGGASETGVFTIGGGSAVRTFLTYPGFITGSETFTLTIESGESVSVVINEVSAITWGGTLPPDRNTYRDPLTGATSDTAPIAGSYFAAIVPDNFYGTCVPGSGNVYLHQSDGTLVETLPASSLTVDFNIIGFPFAQRDLGTDYYILADQGVIEYCGRPSAAISSPFDWNFNTAPYATDPYDPYLPADPSTDDPITLTFLSYSPGAFNNCLTNSISLTFNHPLYAGTGSLYVKRIADGTTYKTFAAGAGTITGDTITFPSWEYEVGTDYAIHFDANLVHGRTGDSCYYIEYPNEAVTTDIATFGILDDVLFVRGHVRSAPLPNNHFTQTNPQTNLWLEFNQNIVFGETGSFYLYTAAGALVQEFDVALGFGDDKSSEIRWINNNEIPRLGYVVLNPTKDLLRGESYYVLSDPLTVRRIDCGDIYWQAGITGPATFTFTVDEGPIVANGELSDSGTVNEDGITLNMDREIEPNTGTINIYNSLGALVATVDHTNPAVTLESYTR